MKLGDVLQTVMDRLNADAWLRKHHWEAIREDDGNILNNIEIKLQGAGEGCVIIASIGEFNAESSSSSRPVGTLQIALSCMETPALNRSRPDFAAALQAAEHVSMCLNLAIIGTDTLVKPRMRSVALANNVAGYNVLFDIHHYLEGK